jgi:hypothetical protein
MWTKLTTLVISGILTVGLVAAAAPPMEPNKNTIVQKTEAMTNACRQSYIEYRYGKVEARTALNKALIKFPEDERAAVALICLGYGEGYEDGKRGTV